MSLFLGLISILRSGASAIRSITIPEDNPQSRSSWIKTMAVNALSSPTAAFRKASSSRSSLTASPSIPLSMLLTLTRVVEFLNDNYNEEEGLYSKSGVGLEKKELLRCCQSQQLPDLSLYNPHSIASVLKQILNELYEPLISAEISQQLVDVASDGHLDEEAEKMVTEIFKQVRFSTREFLQVLLGHLNHISTSGSSKMSVTNLALHVGIALVRPTEDKAALSSKTMIRRRKCVAEFLIRQASTLPYDCATEMNIPALPEVESAQTDPKSTLKELHFVQVTWTVGEVSFTPARLEEIFGKFGEIDNLEINDQGNRAIIAYADPESAEAAERASIASVRVRRRKPRQGDKRLEYSSYSPENHSSLHTDAADLIESDTKLSNNEPALSPSQPKPDEDSPPSRATDSHSETSEPKYNRTDDTMVVEDIEDDQDNFTSDHQDSALPNEMKEVDSKLLQTDSNGEIKTGSPDAAVISQESVSEIPTEGNASKEPRLDDELSVNHPPTIAQIESGPDSTDAQMTDNVLQESNENQKPVESTTLYEDRDFPIDRDTLPGEEISHYNENPAVNEPANDNTEEVEAVLKDESSNFAKEDPALQSLNPTATSAENVVPMDGDLVGNSAPNDAVIEELQNRLGDMEKILSTSAAALSASKLSNEFERAVLQLHQQILSMVGDCLVLTGARHGQVPDKLMAGTNAEFLDFLEAQSRTQVKILEVEVRAGQELLRLHKTQYEKERVELEEEITTLRVGRTETERLCAELRSNLRKCRNELACHVANATDIQRQKNVMEEKLVDSENKLYAKDIALVKLQAEYDKMHRVAAEAQMRTEKFKQRDFDSKSNNNQLGHIGSEDLPRTSKLFSKLSKQSMDKRQEDNPSPVEVEFTTAKIPSQASNVATLEAMKQQMARDIHEQMASTRAALREMEICGSSGKTLEEEEEELRELQRQLAVKSSEIDAAMDESRTKLKELLDPATESTVSNQEPTIFDSTALVNELISRVEKPPTCFVKDISPSYLNTQSVFSTCSIGSEQIAPYHRPSHEAQSFLYRKWTADRSRKMAQLASYRNQQAVTRAQQSMQAFQKALAEAREQR
ncbi:Rho GTPase-activating protein 45 [Phytophthora citrophthora]|uniref:Rho GTPase-activating protein 45 n=1 Tax=Phytophthora citrophthora TaxID=4793 RepID=A0AAD9G2R0_9STRA|nr:Rho GTPase-activating protein 45 [Phytophthora citrophthora]